MEVLEQTCLAWQGSTFPGKYSHHVLHDVNGTKRTKCPPYYIILPWSYMILDPSSSLEQQQMPR